MNTCVAPAPCRVDAGTLAGPHHKERRPPFLPLAPRLAHITGDPLRPKRSALLHLLRCVSRQQRRRELTGVRGIFTHQRAVLHARLVRAVLAQQQEPARVLRHAARLGVVLRAAPHRHVSRRKRRQAAHAQPFRRERLYRRDARAAHARRRVAQGVGEGGHAGRARLLEHASREARDRRGHPSLNSSCAS